MTKALRGLNLGGWLVAERWMTPELFAGVQGEGEIALVTELGRNEAQARLKAHRDSFITERDFEWIAAHGFDFVRLPVGYWLFEETDNFVDGEAYVQKAFEWAERHQLAIVLDFHGLQGSQNGYDHSGQAGKIRLYRGGNRNAALKTLAYMCETYGQRPELLAIELINEPKLRWWLFGWWRLHRYYKRAVAVARARLRPDTKIIVSDAFEPLRMARALSRRDYGTQVVLDVHLYQVFSARDQALSFGEHMMVVEEDWQKLLSELSAHVPVLVGEWSAALPLKMGVKDGQLDYFRAQQRLFDTSTWAHSYWSYKAPGSGVWGFRNTSEFWSVNP